MYPFKLPITDYTHLPDSTIKSIREYHCGTDLLDFSAMPDSEIDNYVEVWLAHLPAFALEEFYNDAMCSNQLMKDTILQVYGAPKEKAETEKWLIRNEFKRPSANLKEPQSWAQKIEECVNCVLENEWRMAG
jgi:hypothetical protein|tara:strand:- start:753 stop:1148 length:396 start_codon:yes stop_codon:yes gene_type:complete